MDELPDLSSLSHAQKDDLIRLLYPLIEQVWQLTARVEELEARLSKDSCGDSQDPHASGFACTRAATCTRAAAGTPPGGLILKTRGALQQR